eukprot:6121898-Pleurochrysis_carterae.AAC.1
MWADDAILTCPAFGALTSRRGGRHAKSSPSPLQASSNTCRARRRKCSGVHAVTLIWRDSGRGSPESGRC